MDVVDTLSCEGDGHHEGARYQSMLLEACKLLDIFERAGGALSLFCRSMLNMYAINSKSVGTCQLFQKLKSGPVLNLKPSTCEPRLRRTAAGQLDNGGSGTSLEHLDRNPALWTENNISGRESVFTTFERKIAQKRIKFKENDTEFALFTAARSTH